MLRPHTTGGDLPPGTVTKKSRILSRKNHTQENPRIHNIEIIVYNKFYISNKILYICRIID